MAKTYQHNGDCGVDCEEFIKSDCVIYEGAIEYLGLEEGATTTEVINKLVNTVKYLQTQINDINQV